MDPYSSNIDSVIVKQDLIGRIVTIHGTVRRNRGLNIIIQKTRAIKKGEIHELIITNNNILNSNRIIDDVAIIGFMEFLTTGLIKTGDKLYVRNNKIGEIIGFNETHMPNHQNIIIYSKKLITGLGLKLNFGNVVYFI